MQSVGSWLLSVVLAVAFTFSSLSLAQAQGDGSDQQRWFTVKALNAGLGEVPEAVERQSPREAIRSFLELTGQKKYAAAAHILNLSNLPPEAQQERGARLAEQLATVLRHGEWLNPANLSGRRDGATIAPSGQNPLAGEARRNLKLSSLTAKGDTYDVRLGRYRVDDEEPVWLIMPDSVESIPLLYEEYGPSLLQKYIPERFKMSLGMLKLWEWIAIPIVLVAIGLLGWGIYSLVGMTARWLPSGSPTVFVERIKGPAALIVMALVAQSLLEYVVSFSAIVTTSFRVLLIAILAWGIGTIALRLVDTILQRMTRRLVGDIDDTKPKDDRQLLTSLYAVRRIIILIMVIAVVVYALSQTRIFGTLGISLLASASVLTVLVGIAGQAVLGNIISSFQVALAKPVRIGDLVIFEGRWCYVEGIFYTFIRLRVWDERRLIVPVRYFVTQPFENLSVNNAKLYRTLELTLHLSADTECIRQKFLEYAKEEDNVVDHDKLLCYVTGQTAMAQTIVCYLMTSEPLAGWAAEMNIREKLHNFIRDNHPHWWPREVVTIGHHDIALGGQSGNRPASEGDSSNGRPAE